MVLIKLVDWVSSSSVSDSHFCEVKGIASMRRRDTLGFFLIWVSMVGYYVYYAIRLVHEGIEPGHVFYALEQAQHFVHIALRLVDIKVKFVIVLHGWFF